jgi:hypothetical protein
MSLLSKTLCFPELRDSSKSQEKLSLGMRVLGKRGAWDPHPAGSITSQVKIQQHHQYNAVSVLFVTEVWCVLEAPLRGH